MINKTLKFDDETIELLELVKVEQAGNDWHGTITGGQLSRDRYVKLNKALEALGGKWNRGKGVHVFSTRPDIDNLKEQGKVVQENYGWFATPKPVADMVAEIALADVGAFGYGLRILEPSAGEGALLDSLVPSLQGAKLSMVELHPERVSTLAAKYPQAQGQIYFTDFLSINFDIGKFDIVVMNPPFEKKQDAQHVLKAYEYLDQGGVLVAVMSAGVQFREDKEYKQVRELASDIVDLPEGAFKDSGTMINAVIVKIVKR